MTKVNDLQKLARKFSLKHLIKTAISADSVKEYITEALQNAVGNASLTSSLGIIPFVTMAQKDKIVLTFDISRNDFWASKTIKVDNVDVQPLDKAAEVLTKYQALAPQVEAYLNKYWQVFPSQYNGDTINYSNFKTTVKFDYTAASPVANQ